MPSDPRFYELRDTPQTDTQGNAIRRFRVPATNETEAQNYYLVDPLAPTVGQVHPRNPSLFCQRVSASSWLGSDSWELIAYYALPGTSFSFNPTDQTTPGSKWLELGFSFRTVEVPYFVIQNLPVPAPPGAPPSVSFKKMATAGVSIKLPIQQISYTRTVNVDTFGGTDDLAIYDQMNKIHTFPNGRRYLFTGASTSQQRANQTQIQYKWIQERDTNLDTILAPLSDSQAYITVIPINGQKILPAYFGFIIGRSLVGDPPLPFIDVTPLYESAPGGYTTLPGSPIP